MKAEHDRALSSGWWGEFFARTKKMKPLGEYLQPVKSADEKRDDGARKLLAMAKRLKRKGTRDGSR